MVFVVCVFVQSTLSFRAGEMAGVTLDGLDRGTSVTASLAKHRCLGASLVLHARGQTAVNGAISFVFLRLQM